jgi:hypothetical protein
MGIAGRASQLERPGFFDGQLLAAADLQDLEVYGSDLRWLHNQSLHQPGIGSGFAASGAKGDREVAVGPGYAIDANGREIVLTTSERLAVPAVAAERDGSSVFFDLAISYADAAALKEVETREGVCLARGAVRYREEPVFCWVRLQRDDLGALTPVSPQIALKIKQGMSIILTRVEVLNCQLRSTASVVQRREARPKRLPYVAAGDVLPDWRPYDRDTGLIGFAVGEFENEIVFAYSGEIDTCGAGLGPTPWYTAHVPGPRILELPDENPDDRDDRGRRFLVVDQLHVQDSRPEGFTAFLLFALVPLFSSRDRTVDLGEAAALIQRTWRVSWMGVEG